MRSAEAAWRSRLRLPAESAGERLRLEARQRTLRSVVAGSGPRATARGQGAEGWEQSGVERCSC